MVRIASCPRQSFVPRSGTGSGSLWRMRVLCVLFASSLLIFTAIMPGAARRMPTSSFATTESATSFPGLGRRVSCLLFWRKEESSETPRSFRGHSSVRLASSQDHSHLLGLQPQSRTLLPQQRPNLQEDGHATIPPSSMYHFWYHRPQTGDLGHQGVQGEAEVQGPQRVALLDTGTAHNHLTVIV